MTDPIGQTVLFSYDRAHRVTEQDDRFLLNACTCITFGGLGHVVLRLVSKSGRSTGGVGVPAPARHLAPSPRQGSLPRALRRRRQHRPPESGRLVDLASRRAFDPSPNVSEDRRNHHWERAPTLRRSSDWRRALAEPRPAQ